MIAVRINQGIRTNEMKQLNSRDLMAPNTEPTDEELQLVMHEALLLVRERKMISDAWMRQRLAEEVAAAFARSPVKDK